MMLEFQITDLEELSRRFEELETAFIQLKGKLCEVHFDPSKPEQVQAAIHIMQEAVDERLSEFPDNILVQQFATGTKEKIKAEILSCASKARRRLRVNGIPFDPLNASALLGSMPVTPSKGWSSAQPSKRRTI
jgi:hypothetical protein